MATLDNPTTAYIYTLVDPVTQVTRYVGFSRNPERRLKKHMSNAIAYIDKNAKEKWLEDLHYRKLKPLITIVEECAWEDRRTREAYWIDHFSKIEPIMNIDRPKVSR